MLYLHTIIETYINVGNDLCIAIIRTNSNIGILYLFFFIRLWSHILIILYYAIYNCRLRELLLVPFLKYVIRYTI